MTFCSWEERGFYRFLSKFKILDEVVWDEEAIRMAISQICWDVARERLDYVELKFTVDKYISHMKCKPSEVIQIIQDQVEIESNKWGILISLVLSLKYESDRDYQKKVITDPDVVALVKGIDLVGDEKNFDSDFYGPLLSDWKKAGKGIEAHVGESQSAENIRKAIEILEVDRVAHGIRIVDCPDIMELARDREICFDIALTSNFHTGLVDDYSDHPIRKMVDGGLIVTVGTDDPFVLQTTLNSEYSILINHLNFSEDELIRLMQNSVDNAFTDFR